MDSLANITKKSLSDILSLPDFEFEYYYKAANQIREESVGDSIHIRALLEFSNNCKKKCTYCGLNCNNKNITRFRMTPEEIIDTALHAQAVGYKTIVLQSGEDSFFSPEILGSIVSEIKKSGIAITLSCGEFSYGEYLYLFNCGASRYLLKHETADEIIYEKLHPGSTLQTRLSCLKALKQIGFETGSGFMIGLPAQTTATIAKDILLLKEIGCDMAGIGPFIPHPGTALNSLPHGSIELTKRAVALTRILMPKINLPATTALGVIDKEQKSNIFLCGANVLMQKITPVKLKKLYEIYPSHLAQQDYTIEQGRINIEDEVKNLGKIPD